MAVVEYPEASPDLSSRLISRLVDWVVFVISVLVIFAVALGIVAQVTEPYDGMQWFGSDYTLGGTTQGGPAALAGLRAGDRILAIDGIPVARRFPLYNERAGTTVSITAVRDGATFEVPLVLAQRPLRDLLLKTSSLGVALLFSLLSLSFSVGARRSLAGLAFTVFYQALAAAIVCGSLSGLQIGWAIRGFEFSLAALIPASIFMASTFPLERHEPWIVRVRTASVAVAAILPIPYLVLPLPMLFAGGDWYFAYQLTLLLVVLAVGFSLLIIVQSFMRATDATARAAARISFLGLGLSLLPFFGLYLVPRLIIGRAVVSAEVTLLFLCMLPLYHGFAITRRRFGGLEAILPPLSAAVISGLVFVIVLVGSVWFVRGLWQDGSESALLAGIVLGAVLLAATNIPVITGARRLVHHAFYGQAYDFQSVVSEMSHDLAQAVGRDELGNLVVETLCRRMNLAGAALLSTRETGEVLGVEASSGWMAPVLRRGTGIRMSGSLAQHLLSTAFPQKQEVLQEALSGMELADTERELIADERAALWVPVITKNVLKGVVVLGQKLKDALFSREDLEITSTLAGQIGVSMENADLYDHLRAEMRKLQDMQDQLIQAEKLSAVGELVSGVAHELNNPLTAVIGYAELLRTELVDEQAKSDVENILRSAERSRRIVRNLLTFARRQRTERRMVDINEVITQTVEIQSYQFRVDNITTELHLDPDLPPTAADSSQLQQVFLNIIMNAYQAIRGAQESGAITITTRMVSPDRLRVSISDDGPGIAPAVAGRIFDPFFTTKEVGVGTGLGLSICYGIVSGHQGRIWCESAPGEGATFFIELPVQRVQATVEAPAPKGIEPGAGLQVLVVEDEPAVSAVLHRLLSKKGCEVEGAANGIEALERIKGRTYDVIISDIKMPGMSGIALWEQLRTERPDLAGKVIFVTGDTASADTSEFLKGAGQPVLPKPFGADELARAIGELQSRS